jgi:hypothetical protein
MDVVASEDSEPLTIEPDDALSNIEEGMFVSLRRCRQVSTPSSDWRVAHIEAATVGSGSTDSTIVDSAAVGCRLLQTVPRTCTPPPRRMYTERSENQSFLSGQTLHNDADPWPGHGTFGLW